MCGLLLLTGCAAPGAPLPQSLQPWEFIQVTEGSGPEQDEKKHKVFSAFFPRALDPNPAYTSRACLVGKAPQEGSAPAQVLPTTGSGGQSRQPLPGTARPRLGCPRPGCSQLGWTSVPWPRNGVSREAGGHGTSRAPRGSRSKAPSRVGKAARLPGENDAGVTRLLGSPGLSTAAGHSRESPHRPG